jgi:hypothetical protein
MIYGNPEKLISNTVYKLVLVMHFGGAGHTFSEHPPEKPCMTTLFP